MSTVSAHACKRCSQRKVKCSKEQPTCSQCFRHGVACEPIDDDEPVKKRRRRFPEAELVSKIRRYESLLRQAGIDPDRENGSSHLDEDYSAGPHHPSARLSPSEERQAINDLMHTEPAAVRKTTTARATQESFGAAAGFFDSIFEEDGTARLFEPPVLGAPVPAHPPPFEIFSLWQIFVDNVHPVVKAVDPHTVYQKLLRVGSNLSTLPESIDPCDHALFFAIYRSAISASPRGTAVPTILDTEINHQRTKEVEAGFRYWFHRADGWRVQDFRIAQALLLYTYGIQDTVDFRASGLVMGMLERVCNRMSLHRERGHEANAAEEEVKRRLWWEVTMLDARLHETAGLDGSTLLRPVVRALPSRSTDAPAAETNFTLMRTILAQFTQRNWAQRSRYEPWGLGILELSTALWTLQEKLDRIDSLASRLHDMVFQHCRPEEPASRLTLAFGRCQLAKLRMAAHLSEESLQARSTFPPRAAPPLQELREKMMRYSIDAMTHFGDAIADQGVRERFGWFLRHHIPAVALMHLLRLLLAFPTWPIADEAWTLLKGKSEGWTRGMPCIPARHVQQQDSLRPPAMVPHLAAAPLVRAWEARAKAKMLGHDEPAFITELRGQLLLWNRDGRGRRSGPSIAALTNTLTHDLSGQPPIDDGTFAAESSLDNSLPLADASQDWEAWLEGMLTATEPSFAAPARW